MKRSPLIFFVFFAFSFVMTNKVHAAPPWYNTSWPYRQRIDFVNTKVSSTLTNFPALIAVTSTKLAYTDFQGGHMGTSTANDIVFTDADQVTKLNHEVESYTSSTGGLVAWVNVPTMADAATTTIYMYYGNSAAGNQQNATSTWNSNYAGVWHLNQTATSTAKYMLDSTKDALNASSSGTGFPLPTSTVIDGGQKYDGNNDYSDAGNNLNFERTNTFSISMWLKKATTTDTATIYNGIGKGSTNTGYGLQIAQGFFANDPYAMSIRSSGSSEVLILATSTNNLNWHYLVGTYDGTSNATGTTIYEDGIALGRWISNNNLTTSIISATSLQIGAQATSRFFPGNIDEVNITSSTRTSGDILTTYNNQSSPSTFEVFGAETVNNTALTVKFRRLLIKFHRLFLKQT